MNQQEFVDGVRIAVVDSTPVVMLEQLEKPGRAPDPKLVDASEWYHRLSAADRDRLRYLLELTADHTVFGLFCVIDGVRFIEGVGEKSSFELRCIAPSGESTLIGGPVRGLEHLHDLL